MALALKTAEDVESWLAGNGFQVYTAKFYGEYTQTIYVKLA